MSMDDYRSGINLGGWLAQYKQLTKEHLDSFITRSDIERIAGWGFDHVRLPFAYELLADANSDGYREEGLSYIDRCLEWCERSGLNVVLDLHNGPGQSYDELNEENPLLSESSNRLKFRTLWSFLAERYKTVGSRLVFDLLNEIVDSTDYAWNPVVREVVDEVRGVDPNRTILVGANQFNSPHRLKELVLIDDPHVVYGFHFYEPLLFTHQRAYWGDPVLQNAGKAEYPGSFHGLRELLDRYPKFASKHSAFVWAENNRSLMLDLLADVFRFKKYTGKSLYCGEYGVILLAPEKSRLLWLSDLSDILIAENIGRAYWNYKEMDFGIVDGNGDVVHPEIVKIIRKRG